MDVDKPPQTTLKEPKQPDPLSQKNSRFGVDEFNNQHNYAKIATCCLNQTAMDFKNNGKNIIESI